MKNINYLITLLFSVSLILASCSRQPAISITKRHYRPGYNVEFNPGKIDKIRSRSNAEISSVDAKTPIEEPRESAGEAHAEVEKAATEIGGNTTSADLKISDSKREVVPADGNNSVQPAAKKKGLLAQSANTVKRLIKKPFTSGIFKDHSNTTAINEGGTVFWTVIAILLVVWLIAVLTGNTFGGLIYLLLVIALIVLLIKLIGRL